jgi:hypothetical protein
MYLTGFVILAMAGTIIQYMYFRRNKDKDNKDKKENHGEEKENLIKK